MITLPREIASQEQLDNIHSIISEQLPLERKTTILVTGDSWAAGEWDSSKDDPFMWRSTHSTASYLELFYDCTTILLPNPGWDDFESIYFCQKLDDLVDYIIFFKTCGLRGCQMEDHPARDFGFSDTNDPDTPDNILKQGLIVNQVVYHFLKKFESKLILIGGLNKIGGDGLDLNTVLTIPSIIEKYDSNAKDTELFGWENMWDFYKDKVKKNKEYRKSLLDIMKLFEVKRNYLNSRPDLYYPDGKHPNAFVHQDLAKYIGEHIWTQ